MKNWIPATLLILLTGTIIVTVMIWDTAWDPTEFTIIDWIWLGYILIAGLLITIHEKQKIKNEHKQSPRNHNRFTQR